MEPLPPTKLFSERLKTLRLRAGFTSQDALADAIGSGQSSVSRWERGESFPDTMQLRALCELLTSKLGYLISSEYLIARAPAENGLIPGLRIVNDEAIEMLRSVGPNGIRKPIPWSAKIPLRSTLYREDAEGFRKLKTEFGEE